MFGSIEQKMEHWAKKNQWDKISDKLDGADEKTRLAAATVCGTSFEEAAGNLLIHLIRDKDKAVQLQAIKSVGMVGEESAKTHLQQILEQLPEDSVELRAAIKESISQINHRR